VDEREREKLREIESLLQKEERDLCNFNDANKNI
jgi:hypothetical protein